MINQAVENLFSSWQNGTEPVLTSDLIADLDETTAYRIQAEYVRLRLQDDLAVGYKVGATSETIRQALGLETPLTGMLLGSGARASGAAVALGDFNRLLIETELAFRAGRSIDEPIDLADLEVAFPTFGPVFELAETGFYGAQRSGGLDMIAANSACAGFVLGAEFEVASFDPNQQTLSLFLDGEALYEANSDQTFGSQRLALHWLVNAMVKQGYRVEPGQIFLTGALGVPQPGKAGSYRADYGALGIVAFELS